MQNIYAMSDIHGFLELLDNNLKKIDLKNPQNSLILCGDYIDYGAESCATLYRIKALFDRYPDRVIVLMGNHERLFLDFLLLPETDIQVFEWLKTDMDFTTVNSFVSGENKQQLSAIKARYNSNDFIEKAIPIVQEAILLQHNELISWLKTLPLFHETDKQIFVHAGVDEEAEDLWRWGTTDEVLLYKYPHSTGRFYKDIIAGHISTSKIAGDKAFRGVFWDGESHYYLDGDTLHTGVIPLLRYDVCEGAYYGDGVRLGNAHSMP